MTGENSQFEGFLVEESVKSTFPIGYAFGAILVHDHVRSEANLAKSSTTFRSFPLS